ncbi:hypothetical protein K227x_26390 [Rubripirellula lacrimiformis]|uniref:Uncharacterized protein n=1 Tax=Rubripirellula lacrimiformis TaxID=1930273 RepID=A0A517NAU2_9BACT|nr:hypothetical protein K227x_26390 [Rubripirellula lacrimiformis]
MLKLWSSGVAANLPFLPHRRDLSFSQDLDVPRTYSVESATPRFLDPAYGIGVLDQLKNRETSFSLLRRITSNCDIPAEVEIRAMYSPTPVGLDGEQLLRVPSTRMLQRPYGSAGIAAPTAMALMASRNTRNESWHLRENFTRHLPSTNRRSFIVLVHAHACFALCFSRDINRNIASSIDAHPGKKEWHVDHFRFAAYWMSSHRV